jgi:hypothetical protein
MNNTKIFLLLLTVIATPLYANPYLTGSKTISLLEVNNEALKIGTVNFHNDNDKIRYEITFDKTVFSDEFLSMRPFKCIRKPKQMICHLIYPYKKQGYINNNDLTDLEYDLLFLHKTPNEYGINAWNGLYYDLNLSGNGINGVLKEVDLNVLAAPPEDDNLRAITEDMLYEADPEIHLFPKLTIE